jgi:hypothetical protein
VFYICKRKNAHFKSNIMEITNHNEDHKIDEQTKAVIVEQLVKEKEAAERLIAKLDEGIRPTQSQRTGFSDYDGTST